MSRWSTALDEFERRLDEFQTVLDDGQAPAGLWPPPDVVGIPLPPDLADRARELLDRAKRIEGEIITRRDAMPPQRQDHGYGVRHRRTPAFSTFRTDL